jgi:hypothetical protein
VAILFSSENRRKTAGEDVGHGVVPEWILSPSLAISGLVKASQFRMQSQAPVINDACKGSPTQSNKGENSYDC